MPLPRRMGVLLAGCLGFVWAPLTACEILDREPQAEIDPAAFGRKLEEDRAQAVQLRQRLEARPATLEALLAGLPPPRYPRAREVRELAFGARRVALDLRSQLVHVRIVVLVVPAQAGRELARIRIDQSPHRPEEWARMESTLAEAWAGSPALAVQRRTDDESGRPSLRIEHGEPELEEAFGRALRDELGPGPTLAPLAELAGAQRTLMDPLTELRVGTGCGFLGSPTPGFLATNSIVAADRLDLLRAILRGPNPEARVFAAHALLRQGTLDPADATTIAKLATLDLRLQICEGCTFGESDWSGALGVLASGG